MSELELEKLTIEDFKLYSASSLKKFLAIRKKPTNGSFDTLVARYPDFVYFSYEYTYVRK